MVSQDSGLGIETAKTPFFCREGVLRGKTRILTVVASGTIYVVSQRRSINVAPPPLYSMNVMLIFHARSVQCFIIKLRFFYCFNVEVLSWRRRRDSEGCYRTLVGSVGDGL